MIDINSGDGNDHYFPDATNTWMVPISGLTKSDYNFCAATALQGCTPDEIYYDGDICPAGWHIPDNVNALEKAAPSLSLNQYGYWTVKPGDEAEVPGTDIKGFSVRAIVTDGEGGWTQKDVPRSDYLGIRCVLKN